jgi:hypothetical protein
MIRQRYEKPQKRTNRLPINQHVWPLKCIARFSDSSGAVCLYDKLRQKKRPAKPNDKIFCARRVWDLGAERSMKTRIEDPFQILASQIIDGTTTSIGPSEKAVIDRFFALWKVRAEFKYADTSPIGFKRVTGRKWTPKEEEEFEYARTLFIREDGTIPAHRFHGIPIQMRIDQYYYAFAGIQWGIVQAQAGQFVVPDTPNHTMIPLAPTLCLCDTKGQTGMITTQNLAEINEAFRDASYEIFLLKTSHNAPKPATYHNLVTLQWRSRFNRLAGRNLPVDIARDSDMTTNYQTFALCP